MLEIEMTERDKQETAFLLRRAEQEAISAIRTGHPDAAAAHFEMALIYGERAREALVGEGRALPRMEENRLRQS
ncbi:MAG: hypothetical protein V4475_16610 [Pseudomonadota bacterium]